MHERETRSRDELNGEILLKYSGEMLTTECGQRKRHWGRPVGAEAGYLVVETRSGETRLRNPKNLVGMGAVEV